MNIEGLACQSQCLITTESISSKTQIFLDCISGSHYNGIVIIEFWLNIFGFTSEGAA